MSSDNTSAVTRRPLRVFLAEDNQADIYLIEIALKEHGLQFTLTATLDGEDAIRRVAIFDSSNCPDIALLDQNLPRVNGDHILEVIRDHAHCKEIPIVIMSSTETRRELELAKKHNATFFRKTASLNDFLELGALVKGLCTENKALGTAT